MIFFTADLHLGHQGIIRLCDRPFSSVEEMDETLIERWNDKVKRSDTIYILGDLFCKSAKPPEEYLRRLKGKKHLILGNHDRTWSKKCDLSEWFESVSELLYINDGKRKLTLCHYPMMEWPKGYMLYGHIHANKNAAFWPIIRSDPLLLNAGVDVNNFEPVSFEEMVGNNERHKAGKG